MTTTEHNHSPSGQHGAAVIILVFFFIAISLAIIQSATVGAMSELRTYHSLATSKFAYVAAEAGIEDVFYRTITEKNIPASVTLVLNKATSTVSVTNISSTERDIYSRGDASNQIRKLYMKATKNVSAEFPYGAQVGEGGMTMGNNVTIDGLGLLNGDIYSDGQIMGGPGVLVTGNAISASGMTADQTASSTSCGSDETVGRTNPNIDFAQSFIIGTTSSITLSKVSLYMKRNGNATNANIRITADAGGHPATTALATEALSYPTVNTTNSWVDIRFTSPPTLDPSTTYWIVFDATQSASKYWFWCRSTSDTYTGGAPLYKQDWSTAGAWTSVAGDMTFKLTYGNGVSQIDSVTVSGTAKADSITNSTIGGDAYYQSISGSSVSGTSYPASPTPPYVPLPLSSSTIAQWKSDAADGGVVSGNCGTGGVAGCNTFPLTLGPKKINGNLVMDNNQTLTLSGSLYVTGSVTVGNNSVIRCAASYLANSCLLIADGAIDVSNNGTFSGSGTSGSFIMLLSTKKLCTGPGSSGTGCSTNQSAISIQNNVNGALFYTTDSMIDISNNAIVTAVVGYMLNLTNNAGIIYDNKVASISFVPDPVSATGAWNAVRWNEYR